MASMKPSDKFAKAREQFLTSLRESGPGCRLEILTMPTAWQVMLHPRSRQASAKLRQMLSAAPICRTSVIEAAMSATSGLHLEEVARIEGSEESIHVMASPDVARELPGSVETGQLKARLRFVGKPSEFGPSQSLDLRMVARALTSAYSFAARQMQIASNDLPFGSVEIDVLKWTALGKTSLDIANILGMTKRSVDDHQAMLAAKLGAESRAQAVVEAIKLGLIGT